MGDAKAGPVCLSFNPQLRVEFRGATVTSDAGLLLPRELDERLGLSALIERHLSDPRTGYNRQFPLPDLFRQSIYSRLAGYEDTNDAERLAEDPTFRMLASRERRETSVALTSTLHWFETEVLAEERNYQGLARAPQYGAGAARSDRDPARDPRHRQLRESGPRGSRAVCLQRPLRVRLLPSPLRLEPGRRLRGRHASAGQRPQCGRVG
jgi:hypothetical protein